MQKNALAKLTNLTNWKRNFVNFVMQKIVMTI